MAELDSFAPDVDIEAELAKEPVDAPEPVEVSEPEPTPEPVAEAPAVAESPAAKAPDGFVPHGALQEERAMRREALMRAEAAERDYAEKMAKLEKRLELLANPPPPVPKFEDDPAAHLKYQQEQIRQEMEPVKQELEQGRQRQQQQAAEAQLTQAVSAAEAEFAKATPDYLDAIAHMQRVADNNLQIMGVADPAQRAQIIRRDAMALAVRALQSGKSPAELAYQVAKNQGYSAKAPGVDKIANIQKGQAASPSMPSGGQRAPTEAISLAALEQMDDEEFNQLVDDPEKWKKLMRG
jgi:hypothetical protein